MDILNKLQLPITLESSTIQFLRILSIAISIIGLILLYNTYSQSKYGEALGKVIESEIKKERYGQGSYGGTRWYLYVKYHYFIGGESYIGDNLSNSLISSDNTRGQPPSKKLKSLLEKYPKGKDIKVYVSLNDPSRSVLIRQGRWVISWLISGLILFFITFLIKREG